MDLRQLRFFVEIARQKSFTRAAERLHIAQPAVSAGIKRLEEELELVLFNRQDRTVSLTAEGELFLEHAASILERVTAARQEMAEVRGLGKGEVRIGIPPMMSAYFFPNIISDFKRRYQNLSLSVYGEGAGRIRTMIMTGELDMGVIAGDGVPETLEARHFLREEVVVCVPHGHPFAGRSTITYEEFSREPLVFYKEGYYQRELVLDALKERGCTAEIVFETNLFSLVKSLVKNGMGISTFLRMAVLDDPGLAAISFDPPLYLDLVIAWKRHAYLSRANRAFVDFLMERTRSWQEAGS